MKLRNAVLPASTIIADLTFPAFVGIHLRTCIVLHGYVSLSKTRGSTTKAVRFYPKWCFATSGGNVLARGFRLASNRYIVCESANVKVCQYNGMSV